ncbi:ly6/PLAUR domain-containing protein 6B isoform X4 [Ornithorhynchus anatinus]|uniref:LY6/PLAUR domain containing 6B n=1 Tax=Ornithorhynchus anatinus TaxID=9258 RepID=A0A6I8NHM6_ORNAN|nr:ly6/PLAUR domain-containing protein 6B isoform X4 [Ornithorhynchus anatinus]XP_028927367.1 ly6/PLAUR domain-containing protein 6B isoform X4 [Ornithorhynchus anatinus]
MQRGKWRRTGAIADSISHRAWGTPRLGGGMPSRCRVLAMAFLQIFVFAENWALAKNINFYSVKPPLDPTPFPNSFKCFTCDRAADNYNCNRWAEDKWCPPSAQYCMTVHHFTNHGRSTSVTKKCASKSDCHFVGCQHHQESGRTECRSCCEGMICNIEVPTNHTNAVLVVLPALRASSGAARTPGLSMLALGLAARWL